MLQKIPNLQPLPHLQFVLIGEVLHQTGNLQTLPWAFLQKLERYNLQPILYGVCDLPGMWTWNLGDRICLANSEKVFDFPYVIFRVTLDGIPVQTSSRE